jgi:MoxR-like ATPase
MTKSSNRAPMIAALQAWAAKETARLGQERNTITRSELLELCQEQGLQQPQWLCNGLEYRAGRGIYIIPSLEGISEASAKAARANAYREGPSRQAVSKIPAAPVAAPAMAAQVIPMQPAPVKQMATLASDLSAECSIPEVYFNYVPFGNFDKIKAVVASKRFFPTFITGPSGNGKTMAVEQACAQAKREFVPVSMTDETDEGDLIGNYVLLDGSMVWRDGPVTVAARKGAVLLIDEIDYGSKNLACLQRVLEGKPFLLKKKNEVVTPAEGFNVIATANTKGQGSDSGKYMYTNILNEAFLERFPITLEQPWAPKATEIKILKGELKALGLNEDAFAKELVEWADTIRKTYEDGGIEEVVSTRRLVHIVKAYGIFNDKAFAVEKCLSRYDAETKTSFLDLFAKVTSDASFGETALAEESAPGSVEGSI